MKKRSRASSGRLYSQQQLVALRFHMLSMAAMADAGDCNAFAAYSPEVYRHGNYIASINLDAADFSHPSGAAYVRITGTLYTNDPYLGGAHRIVLFQQAFDLKPWGKSGTYNYSERSTILDSQMMQPPPFRALSAYAASFFPWKRSSATPCTSSEVTSDCASLDSSSCPSDSAASSASSADTPLPQPRYQRRRNAKGGAGGARRSSRTHRCRQYGSQACE